MNISYYTIDDLRLPAKRLLRKGWTMERFPTLEEALARYHGLHVFQAVPDLRRTWHSPRFHKQDSHTNSSTKQK